MRRPPCSVPSFVMTAAAVTTLLSLMLATPASADTVTPVGQCPPGDSSYSSVGATSAVATAPEGYRIASFCVVGRGNAGPETHTLAAPQDTAVVQHSSGKQLESYSVAYARFPGSSEPETKDDEGDAGEKRAKAERTPVAPESEAGPGRAASADASVPAGEPSTMPTSPGDGEELRIATFEDEDDSADRLDLVIVGAIVIVGLLAGAIALLVRLPGQR